MIQALLPSLLIAHAASAPFAPGSVTGSFLWVKGFLTTNVTVGTTTQTIAITVNGVNGNYATTTVVGAPGTILQQGFPVWLLKLGSTPFAMNFAGKPLVADLSGDSIPTGKTDAIDATGKTLSGVAFSSYSLTQGSFPEIASPAFSIGGYALSNGLSIRLGDTPSAFGLTLNNADASVAGTATFGTVPGIRVVIGTFSGKGMAGYARGVGGITPLHFDGTINTPMGGTAGTSLTEATIFVTSASYYF